MAEARGTDPGAAAGPGTRTGAGLELRLERGGVHVVLAGALQVGGLEVLGLDLQVPDVTLPFDPGAGPGQFQSRRCELCRLEVGLAPEVVSAAAARLDLAALGLERLEVGLRQGFAEVGGRLAGGPAFALRLGLVAGFERGVRVVPYAPRLFGPSPRPAAALPHQAAGALALLGLAADPLPALLRRVLVARGWKVPAEGTARLALAAVAPAGVRLAWDRDPPGPTAAPADPELLAAVEGARAFEAAEALLAAGDLEGARRAYLGAPAAEHPFAAERLLSLLCLEPGQHEQALALAATWLGRRPGFGPALAARAWILEARGQDGEAAEALSRLAEAAVASGERLAVVAAAEAALALAGAGPEARARAVEAALAVQRDHLPALRALRTLARDAGDPGAHLRAVRRLLAYAPTDQEKAQAHAELGELLLERDPPAARLHLDRALKLAPDDPEALATLARACQLAGEHLRSVGALDRLRALRLAAGQVAEAARLALEAGAVWERRLDHPENAGLRYREAAQAGGPVARQALRELVRLLAAQGDVPGTAAALLDAARLAGGREGAALAWRAFSLAGDAAALDQAIAADPTFAPARAARACRHGAGPADAAAALADVEAALAGDPLDPAERPALLRLSAHLAGVTGDRELQRRRLAAACQLGRPSDEALAALSELQRDAGDAEGLAAALERRLDTAPEGQAVALRLELAPLLSAQGRDAEAVARWREVLRLDRSQLPALRALLEPGRAAVLLEGEEPALRTLLARHPGVADPERAEAWSLLAASRRAGGDQEGAEAAAAEAERLRGEDDQGLERRAEAAARAGDRPAAAAALLRRARRGLLRGEPQAAERLAEAALLALEDGLGAALNAEGQAALEEALARTLGPEVRRAALAARLAQAVAAGDEAAEASLRSALVPLLPTGERPGQLVRLSALRMAAGDAEGALAVAEEARTLAPRSLEAVHQARRAAEAAVRPERVAELLGEEAALDGPHAGALLLDRARLLARVGQPAQADLAYTEAQRGLRPDLALAVEQARLRRAALPDRSAAEVVEACARRCEEPAAAARASLAAAALALQAADRATALRCARRAFARRRDVPAEAGPLLARLLYEGGAFAEALVLHRALSQDGFPGFDDADVVPLCRQLAELAAEAGELELGRAALDRLLALRPQDAEAALSRLALDPDRRRAALALAEVAARVRSDATRAALLARAGEVALAEAGELELGGRLFDQARAEGPPEPGALLALAHRRLAAMAAGVSRAPRGEARAAGLVQLAEAEVALLGDDGRAEATLRGALEELPGAVEAEAALLALLARAGRRADQARLLLARARRQEAPAARRALRLEAAALLAGSPEAADRSLEADVLAAVAQDAPDDLGAARAAAQALLAAGRQDEATHHLAALVRADPDDEATAAALAAAYADRPRDRAELFLARAASATGRVRAARLQEAALALAAAGDLTRSRLVRSQAYDADPSDDRAFGAALAEAADDVDRLDAVLAARAGAVAEDAPGCHRARADVLFATGRLERAVEAYRISLGHDGEDPAALATLAACQASLGGAAAAADADRRLCLLAEARPGLVPASLEAEARFRLGLVEGGGPAEPVIEHLTRALWLAPEDPRTDQAFAALVEAHLQAGQVEAALAAARARAERAQAQGDEAAERAALEAGADLAGQAGDRGPDAAALLDRLVASRAAAGEPLEALMPPALRGAEAWRRLGDEDRAQGVLALAGIAAPRRPILVPAPTPPPQTLEAVAQGEAPPDEPRADEPQPAADEPDADEPATEYTPAELAEAWLAEAAALRAAGATEAEVRAALETACAADPDAAAPWLALAELELAAGAPDAAARAHLAASIRSEGAPASVAALEAARLFEEAGLHAEAARAYRAANLAAPGSIPAALIQAEEALARGDLAAAAGHLGQVEAAALPAGALAGFQGARARVFPAGEAEAASEPVAASAPEASAGPEATAEAPAEPEAPVADGRATALLDLVREHAAAGNRRSLAALSEEAEALLGPEPLRPYAASLGRAALEAGRPEAGWRWLHLAFRDDPDDLTVARDLSRAAERTGRHGQEVALGARCADALASHDPLAAAARLRHLAHVADAKLADPERAAALLTRALELVPDDTAAHRERWALWARVPACQPWALTAWTDAARLDPTDVTALDAVATLCTALAAGAPPALGARLAERARLAASLAAFSAPGRAPAPLRLAAAVPDEARARLAAPGAEGPLAALLALLAPYLEPLLPADLARHGVTAADRLEAPHAPALRQALETAGRLLGLRPHVAFLVSRPGLEVALENTRPPALLLPAAAEVLAEGERLFLAARAVDLLGHGWSLAGKFSPRDLGILLELACRFAGGEPPPLGLPAARAGAFLAALERNVPPSVAAQARALGPAATEALATTDLLALATALRRTAARMGLLLTGDPGAALAVLSHLSWPEAPAEPPAPLAQPDLRDLATLALSDPFLELRVAVVG